MISVRTKMKCGSNIMDSDGACHVRLFAIPSDDNKVLTNETPEANVSLTISKGKLACGYFEPGAEYLVDFNRALK